MPSFILNPNLKSIALSKKDKGDDVQSASLEQSNNLIFGRDSLVETTSKQDNVANSESFPRVKSWNDLKKSIPKKKHSMHKTSSERYLRRARARAKNMRNDFLRELAEDTDAREKVARKQIKQLNVWCKEMKIARVYRTTFVKKRERDIRGELWCEVTDDRGNTRKMTCDAVAREHSALHARLQRRVLIRERRAGDAERMPFDDDGSSADRSKSRSPPRSPSSLLSRAASGFAASGPTTRGATLEEALRQLIEDRTRTAETLEHQLDEIMNEGRWNVSTM